jgi:hypothetical protein
MHMGVNKLSWIKDAAILLILIAASIVALLNEVDKHFKREEFYGEVRHFMDKGNRYTPEMERDSIIDQCEHLNQSRVILGQDPINCEEHANDLVQREWQE